MRSLPDLPDYGREKSWAGWRGKGEVPTNEGGKVCCLPNYWLAPRSARGSVQGGALLFAAGRHPPVSPSASFLPSTASLGPLSPSWNDRVLRSTGSMTRAPVAIWWRQLMRLAAFREARGGKSLSRDQRSRRSKCMTCSV